MKKYSVLLLAVITVFAGCKQPLTDEAAGLADNSKNAISVSGTRFIDSYGRQVIFSGINYVNKDPAVRYIPKDSALTFEKFRNWGFNCIRLGVIWDGVEPEPGKYDETYLDKLEQQVNWATENNLYVLLDMHQDLYGVSFGEGTSALGDGAPDWATLTDGQPHVKGFVWSDSYFLSPAVQRAFDNFWANKPAADGIGIQDHYSKMWQHVAKRFAGNKSVIGYDLMNEPFNGTPGTMILPVILTEYAKLFAEETGKVLTEAELLAVWSDEESRFEALTRLEKVEKYSRVIDAATELSQQFEKGHLHEMYQRVANAIREVDTTHILFLEHAYFSNAGVRSGLIPPAGKNGNPDPLTAYAAHGYDLLVDTRKNDDQSTARVEWIFSQVDETSKRVNIPVLVGEWGAFSGNSEGNARSALFIRQLFEKFHFGNTYWAYHPGVDKDRYFQKIIARPYPQFIAGTLVSYGFDEQSGKFTLSWNESGSVKAPTVIYIPEMKSLLKESIRLIPESGSTVVQSLENGDGGYLSVPHSGKNLLRVIEFNQSITQPSISIK